MYIIYLLSNSKRLCFVMISVSMSTSKWRGVFVSTKTGDLLNAITIRLVRSTCRNRPGSRIVAFYGPGNRTSYDDERKSSTIEELGYFDECVNSQGKRICMIDIAKVRQYIANGAEPTIPVWKLLASSGAFPVHPRVYAIAAQNQYMQNLYPQESSDVGINEFPEKYPPYIDDMDPEDPEFEEYNPHEIDFDRGRERKVRDYQAMEKEDRDNQEKGTIRTGDFKLLKKHFNSIEEPSLVQRRAMEHLFVKNFWDLNQYDESGRGVHDNYKSSGSKQKEMENYRKQYWYWTRGVRDLGYTDPFKLRFRPKIHRAGENEQLLEDTKLQ